MKKWKGVNERGQAFSYDFFIAFIIFLVLISAMYVTWNTNVERVREIRKFERIRYATASIVDAFTLTSGQPSNWEQDIDTNHYGLVEDKYELSLAKLNALSAKNYEAVKTSLNIGEYDFRLTVVQDSNTVFSYGQPLSDPDFIIGVQRVVTYNGKPAKLYFKMYQRP